MRKYQAGSDEEINVEDIPTFDDVEDFEEDVEDGRAVDSIFPDEHIQPLRGLLFLGKLENEVEYAGHKFLLKTLTEGELLRVGQLCKPYIGTLSEMESRKMFVVAAALEAVDGELLSAPYKENSDDIFVRANEIKNWYPAVISFLFDSYLELEKTSISVSNSLKKS